MLKRPMGRLESIWYIGIKAICCGDCLKSSLLNAMPLSGCQMMDNGSSETCAPKNDDIKIRLRFINKSLEEAHEITKKYILKGFPSLPYEEYIDAHGVTGKRKSLPTVRVSEGVKISACRLIRFCEANGHTVHYEIVIEHGQFVALFTIPDYMRVMYLLMQDRKHLND